MANHLQLGWARARGRVMGSAANRVNSAQNWIDRRHRRQMPAALLDRPRTVGYTAALAVPVGGRGS